MFYQENFDRIEKSMRLIDI